MITDILARLQRIVKIRLHQVLESVGRSAHHDMDVLLGKQGLGARAHPARDNNIGALFT